LWHQHRKELNLLVAFSALRATLNFSLLTFVPLLWQERGGGLVSGASLVTIFMVVGIIGNYYGGDWADRIGRRRVMVLASAVTVPLFMVFLLFHGIGCWLILALLGISAHATQPVSVLIRQDILVDNPSVGAGLGQGLANGLGLLLMMLIGLFTAHWVAAAVLWINAGVTALALSLAFTLPETDRPQALRVARH
jgi:FSR family fosmidomycin resistance protein-like MFS transporter